MCSADLPEAHAKNLVDSPPHDPLHRSHVRSRSHHRRAESAPTRSPARSEALLLPKTSPATRENKVPGSKPRITGSYPAGSERAPINVPPSSSIPRHRAVVLPAPPQNVPPSSSGQSSPLPVPAAATDLYP